MKSKIPMVSNRTVLNKYGYVSSLVHLANVYKDTLIKTYKVISNSPYKYYELSSQKIGLFVTKFRRELKNTNLPSDIRNILIDTDTWIDIGRPKSESRLVNKSLRASLEGFSIPYYDFFRLFLELLEEYTINIKTTKFQDKGINIDGENTDESIEINLNPCKKLSEQIQVESTDTIKVNLIKDLELSLSKMVASSKEMDELLSKGDKAFEKLLKVMEPLDFS